MDRRTSLGIAGGITLMVAAAGAAIGVNLGILGSSAATVGPGTFEPVAATETTAPAATTRVPTTIYVDESGRVIDPNAPVTAAPTTPTAPAPAGGPATGRYDDTDHDQDSSYDDSGSTDHGDDANEVSGHDDDD